MKKPIPHFDGYGRCIIGHLGDMIKGCKGPDARSEVQPFHMFPKELNGGGGDLASIKFNFKVNVPIAVRIGVGPVVVKILLAVYI